MENEKIHTKDREIVVPGELLAEGMSFLPSGKAFREGDKIHAATVGIVSVKGRVIKVIPLAGKYMPKRGDVVIGQVTNIGYSGWMLDVNSPYLADLNIGEASARYIERDAELGKIFDIKEYVLAEVINVSENKFVKLTAKRRPYRKLIGGNIIEVSPTKIPRIIGKAGSMIKMLKDMSGCDVVVGQNGIVWIKGTPEKESLVAKAILRIEKESHQKGLTDKIKAMLGEKKTEKETKKEDEKTEVMENE